MLIWHLGLPNAVTICCLLWNPWHLGTFTVSGFVDGTRTALSWLPPPGWVSVQQGCEGPSIEVDFPGCGGPCPGIGNEGLSRTKAHYYYYPPQPPPAHHSEGDINKARSLAVEFLESMGLEALITQQQRAEPQASAVQQGPYRTCVHPSCGALDGALRHVASLWAPGINILSLVPPPPQGPVCQTSPALISRLPSPWVMATG